MALSSRWFRVRVTDLHTGKSKANIKIPAELANFGMKIAAWFAPTSADDLDMRQILSLMDSTVDGKLVEVEDEEKGELVEVFLE